MSKSHLVTIVGAGPGGISTAYHLQQSGLSDVTILEKGEPGNAWLDYPEGTRLLSGSTPEHDDNTIAEVAFHDAFPHIEHPTHTLYQKYLAKVCEVYQIPVIRNTEVVGVAVKSDGFELTTNHGETFHTKYLIWSTGQFYNPDTTLPDPACYTHYSQLRDLADLTDDEITIVGGKNGATGIALHLTKLGRMITVVTAHTLDVPTPIDCLWKEQRQTLINMRNQGLVKIIENFPVKRISCANDVYTLHGVDGATYDSKTKPLLCTGFHPDIRVVSSLVESTLVHHKVFLQSSDDFESLKQPNLYFAGVIGQKDHDQDTIHIFRDFGKTIAHNISEKESKV